LTVKILPTGSPIFSWKNVLLEKTIAINQKLHAIEGDFWSEVGYEKK